MVLNYKLYVFYMYNFFLEDNVKYIFKSFKKQNIFQRKNNGNFR